MATEIILPKLGFTMSEGELKEWFAADGAAVSAGQPLYAIESEKSVMEVEAPASGTLRILKATGATYQIGTVLGVVE